MSETAYGVPSPHLPLPRDQRHGTALCFSGGGYRAALFHLGGARRLNELGILSKIDTFTSVSGGSIFAAQLASHAAAHPDAWSQRGRPVPRFEDEIAVPMRGFTQRNIRTRAILTRLNPRNWFNQNAQVEALAKQLVEGPAGSARLSDLPPRPRFVFCSTEMQFRTQWTFDSGQRTYGAEPPGHAAFTDRWTIARAAAASSCLPGAFAPMLVRDQLSGGAYTGADLDKLLRAIAVSDGGVYDNLGVEPVWHDHATVLVSDAGPTFKPDPGIGRIWRGLRFAIALLEQATDVRKRWLISNLILDQLDGAYWGIASNPGNYPYKPPLDVYSESFITDVIAPIRIDLDVFSEGERAVLENHGYLMAETAIGSHARGLSTRQAPLEVPFPEWLDERKAADALRESWKTKLFSRGWLRR
jgi:NTE family protein